MLLASQVAQNGLLFSFGVIVSHRPIYTLICTAIDTSITTTITTTTTTTITTTTTTTTSTATNNNNNFIFYFIFNFIFILFSFILSCSRFIHSFQYSLMQPPRRYLFQPPYSRSLTTPAIA
jgi:hypothetical protein